MTLFSATLLMIVAALGHVGAVPLDAGIPQPALKQAVKDSVKKSGVSAKWNANCVSANNGETTDAWCNDSGCVATDIAAGRCKWIA